MCTWQSKHGKVSSSSSAILFWVVLPLKRTHPQGAPPKRALIGSKYSSTAAKPISDTGRSQLWPRFITSTGIVIHGEALWKQSHFMTYPFCANICSQFRLYICYLGEFTKNKTHRYQCFSTNDVIRRACRLKKSPSHTKIFSLVSTLQVCISLRAFYIPDTSQGEIAAVIKAAVSATPLFLFTSGDAMH